MIRAQVSDQEPPTVTIWRTKLRSTLPDVDHSAQGYFAITA